MAFIFRPGNRLFLVEEFSPRTAFVDYPTYDDSDNDQDEEVVDPTWNYEQNMPQAVYQDL